MIIILRLNILVAGDRGGMTGIPSTAASIR
jgi:hypothetical protein